MLQEDPFAVWILSISIWQGPISGKDGGKSDLGLYGESDMVHSKRFMRGAGRPPPMFGTHSTVSRKADDMGVRSG